MNALPEAGAFAPVQRYLETESDVLEAILSYLRLTGSRYLTIRGQRPGRGQGLHQATHAACEKAYRKAEQFLRLSAACLPPHDVRTRVRIRVANDFRPDASGDTYSVEGLFERCGPPSAEAQGPIVKILQDELYAVQRLHLLATVERKTIELVGHALLPVCLI